MRIAGEQVCAARGVVTHPPTVGGTEGPCKPRTMGYNGGMHDPGFIILYEQGPCLVVHKPPGLLTQAPAGIDSLELRIRNYVRVRDSRVGKVYLGVPHRLDRPASGVMIFTTLSRATRRIGKQFERRQVRKTYWAVVEGIVDPPQGTWRDHMWKVTGEPRAEIIPPEHPEARLAVLHYRTRAVLGQRTWLEIELETGRTHQIRLQAGSRGHAILGDRQYGSTVPFGTQFEDERLRAIALHARQIEFQHPMTKEAVSVSADPSADWPISPAMKSAARSA
ncbi:MAG: RluA family pseudouridine synthase [Planctomycetota bacterium]